MFAAPLFAAFVASAQLVEPFSYENGSLTTVSGGAWETWAADSGNATVNSQAVRYEDSTDVIRFVPNVFTSSSGARISFDININQNSTEMYEVYFFPSQSPADGTGNSNYTDGFVFRFGEDNTSGSARVTVYDCCDAAVGFHSNVANITTNATHNVIANLALSGTIVTYSVSIDNTPVLSNATFSLNDPRGLAAVELFNVFDDFLVTNPVDPAAFATLDNLNITAVPEPAFAMGFVALALPLTRRRSASIR